MGCTSSSNHDSMSAKEDSIRGDLENRMYNGDIVDEFVRLDEQIGKLESMCPAARLATAEAWIDHMQTKYSDFIAAEELDASLKNQQESASITNALEVYANGDGARDLAKLAISLGVITDVQKASTHEDFFAKLSESVMQLASAQYFTEIFEHTMMRLKSLTESYTELNQLYVHQDGLIAHISGGTYMTPLEQNLDSQVETARDIRDKLASALEQWRICGLLLRACANSATQSLQQWKELRNMCIPSEKIQLALECRNTIQASLVSLECAQLSLPQVEIKYISHRQILAMKHVNTYMITDIADNLRYDHTTKVIEAYEINISKASSWLYDTFNKTLRKDFDKAEDVVRNLTKALRDHRQEIFTAARIN